MSASPQLRVAISAVAGGLTGVSMCVLPAAFGYGDPGRPTFNWLALGWPGVWAVCALAAGLITIPLTVLTLALSGSRYSVAEPLARQVYRKVKDLHPQPDSDRELGMLAGAMAGFIVCAAVPPLLAAWSTAPPEAAFRGNALADLLVTGAVLAGATAKLAYLELYLRRSGA